MGGLNQSSEPKASGCHSNHTIDHSSVQLVALRSLLLFLPSDLWTSGEIGGNVPPSCFVCDFHSACIVIWPCAGVEGLCSGIPRGNKRAPETPGGKGPARESRTPGVGGEGQARLFGMVVPLSWKPTRGSRCNCCSTFALLPRRAGIIKHGLMFDSQRAAGGWRGYRSVCSTPRAIFPAINGINDYRMMDEMSGCTVNGFLPFTWGIFIAYLSRN